MDVDQELLTQAALARRWKVSPRTLERWRWLGRGPQFMKVGGQVRYRLPDIEAYEAAQLRATSTSANIKSAAPLRLVRA
ncbi:MAG: helix-turn-helix domain-containing protein [Bauldia sp.]|nr:helix-turn-helix domain-containing protein [Paracoccaceae bacterium]MCB1500477.1 helix-turn-helix domain-containing protein [Bauldia sp.]